MRDFERCNKLSGIYWLKKPISKLHVRIKLKQHNGISLPHFEEFTKNANPALADEQRSTTADEYIFKWQQKTFSLWELSRYADSYNCITESERKYNNLVKNNEIEPSKVFTYVDGDNFLPKSTEHKLVEGNTFIDNLNSCLAALKLSHDAKETTEESISVRHLFKSDENLFQVENKWMSMHVVMDSSEYNEEKQLLLKNEALLLSLYYDESRHCLIATPDVNDLSSNAYQVATSSGQKLKYDYSIDFDFDEGTADCGELELLLQKLSKKWSKKHQDMIVFDTPSVNSMRYFVNLEILTAENFEMDNLYINYTIKLPEGVTSNDALHGNTHSSAALRIDGSTEWHFGHLLELQLESEVEWDPSPIHVFLEVISTDWWGRHRTEGYSYMPLALTPGRGSKVLTCVRPEEKDHVEAESRRFFVGGCHLLKDLDVLKTPTVQDATFRYLGSGCVRLRWGSARQGAHGCSPAPLQASAVLRRYQEARERLAAAMGGGDQGRW